MGARRAPKSKPAGYSGKSRAEKLGVKAGQRVALVGAHDAGVRSDVAALGAVVTTQEADWYFVALAARADLARLDAVRARMPDDAGIWAVWPKGRKEFTENDVRKHALAIRLVDVKVMAWSETHSGLKLVVPLKERAPARPARASSTSVRSASTRARHPSKPAQRT